MVVPRAPLRLGLAAVAVVTLAPPPASAQVTLEGQFIFPPGATNTYPYGFYPVGAPAFDSAGNAYLAMYVGGGDTCYCGTVLKLTPPPQGRKWRGHVAHRFTGGRNGAYPFAGLTLDGNGNVFGTTYSGGKNGKGTVFELPATMSGLPGAFQVLTSFAGGSDGDFPQAAPVLDAAGNLYGTTFGGTFGSTPSGDNGTAFVLRAPTAGRPHWQRETLHPFQGGADGGGPAGPLTLVNPADAGAGIYGTTYYGGANGLGTLFMLTQSRQGWTNAVLVDFPGGTGPANPSDRVSIVGVAGDTILVGTSYHGGGTGCGGSGCGTLWEYDSGTKQLLTLHAFAGPPGDGQFPFAAPPLPLSTGGEAIVGTTASGGASDLGTLWHLLLPNFPAATGGTYAVDKSFAGGADGANPAGPTEAQWAEYEQQEAEANFVLTGQPADVVASFFARYYIALGSKPP